MTTDATARDLVIDFRTASQIIRRLVADSAGWLEMLPSTEAAYARNTQALFEIERRLREADAAILVPYLRVEHELTVARTLTQEHSENMRASALRQTRRTLAALLNGEVGGVVVPGETGHNFTAAGLISGDG